MENDVVIKKHKILIVDDSRNNIRVLERTLDRYSYIYFTAEDGETAIEIATTKQPDLILLDIMMPGMNGYEVCVELRKKEETMDIPILMVTAKDNINDIINGLNVGANDYITKPFKPEILRARIRTALRLKILNDELKEKNLRLKELNEIKDQFMSMASHDIKNNLTGILGHCYILSMDSAKILTGAYRKSIDIIKKRGERITNLVTNLLDLTKIESGNLILNVSKINLLEYLEKYFEEISLLYKNEKINFELKLEDNLGEAEFDTEKIDEVLTNLVNNAIKFNKEKGLVTVKCEFYRHDKIKISVVDNGIGISEDNLDVIFEKFKQLKQKHAFKRTFKGSGLGLNIVKKIVEAHKGKVGVNSEINNGSEFYFILPRRQ